MVEPQVTLKALMHVFESDRERAQRTVGLLADIPAAWTPVAGLSFTLGEQAAADLARAARWERVVRETIEALEADHDD